jgi:hypothetical protein
MDHYLGVAKKEGLTDDEISTVQSIVMVVAAGRIDAQVREVRSKQRINPSRRPVAPRRSNDGT